MGEVLAKSATALLIFGAAALLLALGGGNVDRIIVRIFIQFPLLMILAAISVFLINLAAALIGKVLLRQALVAALIAAFLGWAIAGYNWEPGRNGRGSPTGVEGEQVTSWRSCMARRRWSCMRS